MDADTTGSDTPSETPIRTYRIVIEGDELGLATYEFEEVASTLAVEQAMFKYADEFGHPRTTLSLACNEVV